MSIFSNEDEEYEKLTYFQIYSKGEIDFTEKKLLSLIKKYKKKELENVLKVILKQYKLKNIAVAWKSGEPVYIPISNKEDTEENLKKE